MNPPSAGTLPPVSRLLRRWFVWYCRRYFRRHFHSLHISCAGMWPETAGRPLVLFSNHASWWDPLVGLIIVDDLFPARTAYAPIDAAMLQQYRMFTRLGFFGIERNTTRGAVRFLRTAGQILQSPQRLLALTPQGRFADPRERPVRFQGGLGHLAARIAPRETLFLPMASEYVYWEERLPEVLVRFGPPLSAASRGDYSPEEWTDLFERSMTEVQDALAREAQRRDPRAFQRLLQGRTGQGGVYDLWRWWRARFRHEFFNPNHGHK